MFSMTAQGITYMEASGDFGAGAGLGRGANKFYYPHEDPEVLSIGGTVAKTDAAGTVSRRLVGMKRWRLDTRHPLLQYPPDVAKG